MKKVVVIGGGFAGMTAAAFMAKAGYHVDLIEKNNQLGGRNRQFKAEGFTFDMGPSWYWMPELFERFYNSFERSAKDFYHLERLSPSYNIFWPDKSKTKVPANLDQLYDLFEKTDPGSGQSLQRFLEEAGIKYRTAMSEFVYKPSLSFNEYFDKELIKQSFKLDLFTPISKHIRKFVSHPKLIQILEFPVLFLGAKPNRTPALYSMMNYADMVLGTWYPVGGMYEITKAFSKILIEQGVNIHLNEEVQSIGVKNKKVNQIHTSRKTLSPDIVISGADYHHTEQDLLQKSHRSYKKSYWDKKIMAPSCLLFYLGINKKLPNLEHHNLFFDTAFERHADEIYDSHTWPLDPMFYVSNTSKTDDTAPEGCENIFILIPISTELSDDKSKHDFYLDLVLTRMERQINTSIKEAIIFKKSYCIDDFKMDYNAYKGNAYGLANTLLQTGPLRPRIKSKKVDNLFFAGQLTVPGPGVPPAIISGEIVSKFIIENQKELH